MTDTREVNSFLRSGFSARFERLPSDLSFATFLGSWQGEYSGAWVIGSRKDIKLLAEFGAEDGFSLGEPREFQSADLGSYLAAAFRDYPRGYLCLPFGEAAAGVRLLRFTQVSSLRADGRVRVERYILSSPSGEIWVEFDPSTVARGWFETPFPR